MRLRRSKLDRPGWTRRRAGSGFTYRDADGGRLAADDAARVRALVIPPAWQSVWISPDPRGHIQATGVDAAGRKQYRYHDDWRTGRDLKKFDHAVEVAERLPELREQLCHDLTAAGGLTEARVLAAIVRLLDMGMFRVGSDQYAQRAEDPSYGVSTLRPDHVHTRRGEVVLEFPGKSGVAHETVVPDGEVCAVLTELRRRRRGEDRLFAYWNRHTRRWHEVHAEQVNDYLRAITGEKMTAKDFRTWKGTVTAARELAAAGPAATRQQRDRHVRAAVREVAGMLGNTPAVARASYIDPRVIENYDRGEVADTEERVLRLLKRAAS